jgi:hypothetical protein
MAESMRTASRQVSLSAHYGGDDRGPLVIDGLWELMFGNGFLGQSVDNAGFHRRPK